MPKFFDIHSHLNDKQFDKDLSSIVSILEKQDTWTITVGVDKEMSKKACDIAQMGKGIFASVGMHPTDNPKDGFEIDFFRNLVEGNDKVVAIGECGLEYFRIPAEKEVIEKSRQIKLFEDQIELAVMLNKPIIVHCRDAHEDVIDILKSKKQEHGDVLRGDIHFFSGDIEIAKKYFDIDFTISFTGVITFVSQYDNVIKYAPLTHIMAETDAPYVAPVPHRGKRCEPQYVVEVVKRIAEIRGEDLKKVSRTLVDNSLRVFQIPLI